MPYKFKNDGSGLINPRMRKIYLIIAGIMIAQGITMIAYNHHIKFGDLLSIGSGLFLFWGIQYQGFYKLARFIAEWNMRRRDNPWR